MFSDSLVNLIKRSCIMLNRLRGCARLSFCIPLMLGTLAMNMAMKFATRRELVIFRRDEEQGQLRKFGFFRKELRQ